MRRAKDVNELLEVLKICSFVDNQHVDANILHRCIQNKTLKRFANIASFNSKTVDISEPIKHGLENLKKTIHLQNKLHSQVIIDIQKIIQNTNLEIILLKSTALNNNIYRSNEIRASADIDILIKKEDKVEFDRLFSNIAVKINRPKTPFEDLYEETWKLKKNNIYIDIHYNIANPNLFNINVKSLFDNSIQHPHYQSEKIRVLAPPHAFIHMGLHMYTDCNYLHHSLVDACNIYIRTNVDQKYCENIAKEWRCSKVLSFLLYMLNFSFNLNLDNSKNNLICKYLSLHSNSNSELIRRAKQITFQYCLTDNISYVIKNQIKYLSSFITRAINK